MLILRAQQNLSSEEYKRFKELQSKNSDLWLGVNNMSKKRIKEYHEYQGLFEKVNSSY